MKALFFCITAGVLLCAQVALAKNVEPVGYVQSERGEVVAVNESQEVQQELQAGKVRPLYRNAALYQQDMVVTGASSKAQLMFRDGTTIAMDENSQMRLDQFNFDFNNKENNILKFLFGPGLFRFLTGKLVDKSPDKFNLETPLGALGIRGTDGGVEAVPSDAASHAQLCNSIVSLKESGEQEQDKAPGLFQQGLGLAVDSQNVYHFKGFKTMTFQDTVTSKTVMIPRGKFITVTSADGAGEPQDIGFGQRGLVPSLNTRADPPSALKGTLGGGGGGNDRPGSSGSSPGHGGSSGRY